MGKKVNVYLDDEMLKVWNSVPSGQRSSMIKKTLRLYSAENISPKQEIIMQLKEKLHNTKSKIALLQHEKEMIEKELLQLGQNKIKTNIDKKSFFDLILKRAKILHEKNANYRSFTGKSYYRIYDTTNNKIYIENFRTGRKNSNFSKQTTDLAIDRLMSAGGRLPIGEFIPVKMHEYTVVHLHPNLSAQNGFIIWQEGKYNYVTEEMIPSNPDLSVRPPEEWVSEENWLAVTIDGIRAHVCIYNSTTHWSSSKITIAMMDYHPHFSAKSDIGDQPWMTKHFNFYDTGIFYWGHHNLKGGGGGTHTILTR